MTVATRIADGRYSLKDIVLTAKVLLMSSLGTLPKHSATAELGKPLRAKLALLPVEKVRVVGLLGWRRKGRR